MRNAKEEFIKQTRDKIVLCVVIYSDWDHEDTKTVLKVGYSEEDYANFLNSLNFEYDAGYGGQELFGMIWYTDGTWSERGEYDGSEWWDYRVVPVVPEYLK